MRVRSVVAGHAFDWRSEGLKGVLLDERAQLSTEARGQGRLVYHHAPPRLLDRTDDGIQIERDLRAEVDDFGVDTEVICCGQSDVHHRPVGEHRRRRAGASNDNSPEPSIFLSRFVS